MSSPARPQTPDPSSEPVKLPRSLPFELPDDTPGVLFRVYKCWDTMTDRLAEYLEVDADTLLLSVKVPTSKGQEVDMVIHRSAWPGCIKQIASLTGNAMPVITVKWAYMGSTPKDTRPANSQSSDSDTSTRPAKRLRNTKKSPRQILAEKAARRAVPMKGGKPVIYLYPRKRTEVSVKLSLCPEWGFSAVYPTTDTIEASDPTAKPDGVWEHIKWDVVAEPNSVMKCVNTGVQVPYLFWEATSNGTISRADNVFSPVKPSLHPCDTTAVVVPVTSVPAYLNRALEGLGLDFNQRTDFITYWLDSINKHTHLALRFLPQHEYDPAAPMDINPKPDHVTRIFMLFRGVKEDELTAWQAAQARADAGVDWGNVVGIDEKRQRDTSLFRVLEWGGGWRFTESRRSRRGWVEAWLVNEN